MKTCNSSKVWMRFWELDIRILALFKGKEEIAIGDLRLVTVGLYGSTPILRLGKLPQDWPNLSLGGLILRISTNAGVG